jgi:hypothetical protein
VGALPTFFVIGAAKAGTTSLHAELSRHPQIGMAAVKEPRYFVAAPDHHVTTAGRVSDRASYEALFDPRFAHRGESSTSYSMFPIYQGIPERIRASVPDARFIYLVRDPVERALSHYQQSYFAGLAGGAVDEALSRPDLDRHPFVSPSRYATQLGRYLACFPSDRIHVVDQAAFAAHPRQIVRDVVTFVGADPDLVPDQPLERQNVTAGKRREQPALTRLRRSDLSRRALGRLPRPLQTAARRTAIGLLTHESPPPEASPATVDGLRRHLAPEAERLRRITGATYESWSV